MGSIPVAQPSPLRPWRFSRRIIPLALLALAAIAVAAVGVAVAWPSSPTPSDWTAVARADDLRANEPVLNADVRIFIVRLDSGEILALSRRDPHRGCTVPWRRDFTFEGRTGWFRDPCYGSTYDVTGVCYAGPCPRGLDRYQVRVEDGDVEVDLTHLIMGPDRRTREGRPPVNPAEQ
jgi:nitrite reductase/ring-hydroxylating ferredoxin subunit